MSGQPSIEKVSPLDSEQARWLKLQKIDWVDQNGNKRVWESVARTTRGATGVDAVAIAPILLHPTKPASVVIIQQYRPPPAAMSVEFPAGLLDPGETAEEAALRELKEETGYEGRLISITPILTSDAGMSPATMQFAVVEVDLKEGESMPDQNLGEDEFIEREIVPLNQLHARLLQLAAEGKIVDSKLFHFAFGLQFGVRNQTKYNLS
jgi:ADP-ribose pyrophosphatase